MHSPPYLAQHQEKKMSNQGSEVVRYQTMGVALAEANTAIEQLTAGGIVESATDPVTALH